MSQRAVGRAKKKKVRSKKNRVQEAKPLTMKFFGQRKKTVTKKVSRAKQRSKPMADEKKKTADEKKHGQEPDPMATPPDTPPALPGDAEQHPHPPLPPHEKK